MTRDGQGAETTVQVAPLTEKLPEMLQSFWAEIQRPEVAGVYVDKDNRRMHVITKIAPDDFGVEPLHEAATDEEWLSWWVRNHTEIFEQSRPNPDVVYDRERTEPLPLLADLLHEIDMETDDTVVGIAFHDVSSLQTFFYVDHLLHPENEAQPNPRAADEKVRRYAPYQLRKNRVARADRPLLGYRVYFVSALPANRPAVLTQSRGAAGADETLTTLQHTDKNRPKFDRVYLSHHIEEERTRPPLSHKFQAARLEEKPDEAGK